MFQRLKILIKFVTYKWQDKKFTLYCTGQDYVYLNYSKNWPKIGSSNFYFSTYYVLNKEKKENGGKHSI